jgi:hypothetical protein
MPHTVEHTWMMRGHMFVLDTNGTVWQWLGAQWRIVGNVAPSL